MILQRKVNMTKKINILVVDDNQINRQYLSMALKKFGYDVTLAENGLIAIEEAKIQQFDLIFMDIRMPEMDGYEATEKIRSFNANLSIPIIAVSAEENQKDQFKLFNGYILKPISPSQLKLTVEKFCQTAEFKFKVFDKNQALKYSYNDNEILQKLIKLFLKDLPIQMNLLEQSIKSSNHIETNNIIHKLMGSSQTCGAKALNEDLKTLSKLNKQNSSLDFSFEKTKLSVIKFINQVNSSDNQ